MMVFHWSLSYNKSPQVSRNLLSILADLNNTVVWMVSPHPFISKASSLRTNPLVTAPRALITIGIIVTFMIYSYFNSLSRSRYLSLFSHFLNFTLWSAMRAKSTILQVLFYFVDYFKIWSSGQDLVISLYLKVPEEFVRITLKDRFLVVHIPFVCMLKLQLLAKFPVDHLAHAVVYSLIIFPC